MLGEDVIKVRDSKEAASDTTLLGWRR